MGESRQSNPHNANIMLCNRKTLRNETNVIMYYYLIPCRLSTDPEIYDLGPG